MTLARERAPPVSRLSAFWWILGMKYVNTLAAVKNEFCNIYQLKNGVDEKSYCQQLLTYQQDAG